MSVWCIDDMNEDLVTVGLGRRVVKESSSMLPRSVPPLWKSHHGPTDDGADVEDDDDSGEDVSKVNDEQGPEVKICAFKEVGRVVDDPPCHPYDNNPHNVLGDNPDDDVGDLKETQILVSGRRLGRRSGSGDLNTRRMFPHW